MASTHNRFRKIEKIDEFFCPKALVALHVGNNSNRVSTAMSNEVEMRGVAEETEAEVSQRTNVALDSTQVQTTRPYCTSRQYAPPRLANKKCHGTPLEMA